MILIACGMQSESAILNSPSNAVVVQGRNRDANLKADLQAAVDKGGIIGVMSFGLSGGLADDLDAGDILVATGCVKDGLFTAARKRWTDGIMAALSAPSFGLRAKTGWFCYSNAVVATSAEKYVFQRGTRADAVDMETCIAAEVADANDLPFTAIRAISDPFDFNLPPAALAAMSADGSIDVGAVLDSIAGDDRQVSALITLKGYSDVALANLSKALLAVGPKFCFPGEDGDEDGA